MIGEEVCKYLNTEDVTPWQGDVFDHPEYKNTCQLTGKEIIPFLHCKKERCKHYSGVVSDI